MPSGVRAQSQRINSIFPSANATKHRVHELLRSSRGCHVPSFKGLQELELRPKTTRKLSRIVPFDRQATAALRTFETERGNDDMSPEAQRQPERAQIGCLIDIVRQEVEYRAVMPHIHLFRQTKLSRIRHEPGDTMGALTQPAPG